MNLGISSTNHTGNGFIKFYLRVWMVVLESRSYQFIYLFLPFVSYKLQFHPISQLSVNLSELGCEVSVRSQER